MTAAERAAGRYMRAPDHPGGDGGGGGGGAAGLLDDEGGEGDKGGAGGEGDKGGAGGEGDKGGAGGEGDKGSAGGEGDPPDLSWASGVSAEKGEGEDSSNLDWLKSSNVKDMNGLVKIARDSQRSLRESGKVKIPGEDAKPEEIKAFREAIGAPEKAEGYTVKVPEVEGEGDFKLEVDTEFLAPFREIAHKHNVSQAFFEELGGAFVNMQLEDMKNAGKQADDEMAATVKEWGDKADQNKMDFKRGAEILGLSRQDLAKLQSGGATPVLMNTLAKVGQLAGEDFFAGEGGSQKFGVTSLEEAQGELDRMNADKDVYAKLKAKDPQTVQKYNRLTEAVAHFRERNSKKK